VHWTALDAEGIGENNVVQYRITCTFLRKEKEHAELCCPENLVSSKVQGGAALCNCNRSRAIGQVGGKTNAYLFHTARCPVRPDDMPEAIITLPEEDGQKSSAGWYIFASRPQSIVCSFR
jgi:hypothetical protein